MVRVRQVLERCVGYPAGQLCRPRTRPVSCAHALAVATSPAHRCAVQLPNAPISDASGCSSYKKDKAPNITPWLYFGSAWCTVAKHAAH